MPNISKKDLMIIKNEVIMSEKLIDCRVIPQMTQALSRYVSQHVPSIASNWDIVLNEIYPIIQQELPSIFFRNPRAFLKPRTKNFVVKKRNPLTGKKEDVFADSEKSSKTQEHLLNYTIETIKYKQEVRKILLDALLFRYAILWHGYKGNFGITEEQSIFIESEQIFVKRLSPRNFIFDPKVTLSNLDEARWTGRSMDIPIDELREDSQLKLDKHLKGKPGFQDIADTTRLNPESSGGQDKFSTSRRSQTLLDFTSDEFKKEALFVRVYEIFMRPTPKEKSNGGTGRILLFTPEQSEPLRDDPWPYKTKGWPAKVLYFNDVPESIFPMSDLEVYGPIVDQKNVIINLQLANAQSTAKNTVFYDENKQGSDEEWVRKVTDGEQNVVGMNGRPSEALQAVSLGGQASSELYILDTRIQANLDEKSGVTDLKKGSLRSGEESAESVRIRNAGSNSRFVFRQDMMSDFLKDSFKYINDLNQQFMPIKEAVRIMGSLDIEWSENPSKEEIQADVDVEIDAYSMLPENPRQELAELNTVLQMAVQALNDPAVLSKITQEGKMFNISPLIENILNRIKIRNPDVFRNIRPEESQGFASVAELRAAEANVQAAVTGQQLPSPPEEGQDHAARLGVYVATQQILKLQNQVSDILEQLIFQQQQIAELETKQKAPRPNQKVVGPTITSPQ